MDNYFIKCIDGKWSIFEKIEPCYDSLITSLHVKGVPWFLCENTAIWALDMLRLERQCKLQHAKDFINKFNIL